MMRTLGRVVPAAVAALIACGAAAQAAPGHKGGHYSFGEPGKEADVVRTVEVVADDHGGMRFVMDVPSIQQGETIRFVVTNEGAGEHKFSIGDTASQRAHARLMAKNPEMKHEDDPSAVHVTPGETETVIWKFSKPIQGHIVFACQMPGHYEAGMAHQATFEKGSKAGTS
jgi:uncharacterized cupredoxin-like copper-binding protein